MNSIQSKQYDNEISLTDIIRSIWAGKWVVIGVTIVTSIITAIYLTVIPKTYIGKLEIFPISEIESSKYIELNSSKLFKTDNRVTQPSYRLDGKKFELLFMQNLREYKGFEASIIKNKYLKKIENETELDFLFRVKKAARVFSLSKQENKRSSDIFKQKGILTLSIITHQPSLVLKVISDALLFSNNMVDIQVQNQINGLLDLHSRSITNKLEDLEISSKLLLNNEKLKIQSKLAYLHEQKAIARALDIEKNTRLAQIFPTESKLDIRFYNEEQYLRGYLVINKEIELLLSRKSPQLFVTKILANELRKNELIQDQTVIRAKELVSLTPIGTDEFRPVIYDVNLLKLKRKINFLLVLTLSVILGVIFGIVALGIRNVVISKR